MIESVDNFIINRLLLIRFEGAPIKVYGYEPTREKGETIYPCISGVRKNIEFREKDVRYNFPIVRKNPGTQTVKIPRQMDLNEPEVSGPVSYTFKPYPSPINIDYEIITHATKHEHATALIELVLQTFPLGYQPRIFHEESEQVQEPYFDFHKPVNYDELDKPLYRTCFVYNVGPIWIDRLEALKIAAIKEIDFDSDITIDYGDVHGR